MHGICTKTAADEDLGLAINNFILYNSKAITICVNANLYNSISIELLTYSALDLNVILCTFIVRHFMQAALPCPSLTDLCVQVILSGHFFFSTRLNCFC